jgi:DNA-binding response OmpR family regulator
MQKVTKPRNTRELSARIKKYVTKNGESALLRLAEIHPDRELIEAVSITKEEEPKNENFSNLSGKLTTNDKEYVNSSKLLMVGGFILIGLAIIMTKK